jgi:ankyrin repeat protein
LLTTYLLTGSDKEFEGALQSWVSSKKSHHFNVFGQSPVHLAIHLPSRLKRLVQSGMDHDAVDRGGTTPMMYAAAYGQLDSVLILIQYGSRPDLQDRLNNRIFVDYAIRFRHLDLVKGLVTWLRDEREAVAALSIIDRCVNYHLINSAATMDMAVPTLKTLMKLGGDPDVLYGTRATAMHLVNTADLGKVLLKYDFTAVDVRDEAGKTALMHTIRFLDPGLTRALLDLQSAADTPIDQRDRTQWSLMHHLFRHMRRKFSGPWDSLQVRFRAKTNAIRCMNLILRRGADVLLTDTCECPCSPGGCSPMSIALHQALEVTRPMSYRDVLNTLPVDLAIGLLAYGDEKLRTLSATVATFSTFVESGRKHSCCALTRVRPSHYCAPDDAQVTDNQSAVKACRETCTIVGNASSEKDRLISQLARFYTLLERRSQARYENEIAEIRKSPVCGPSKKPELRSSRSVWVNLRVKPAQRLNLQDYRYWIFDCEKNSLQLYTGMSLERWVRNGLEFVDGLDREMERLRVEESLLQTVTGQ